MPPIFNFHLHLLLSTVDLSPAAPANFPQILLENFKILKPVIILSIVDPLPLIADDLSHLFLPLSPPSTYTLGPSQSLTPQETHSIFSLFLPIWLLTSITGIAIFTSHSHSLSSPSGLLYSLKFMHFSFFMGRPTFLVLIHTAWATRKVYEPIPLLLFSLCLLPVPLLRPFSAVT